MRLIRKCIYAKAVNQQGQTHFGHHQLHKWKSHEIREVSVSIFEIIRKSGETRKRTTQCWLCQSNLEEDDESWTDPVCHYAQGTYSTFAQAISESTPRHRQPSTIACHHHFLSDPRDQHYAGQCNRSKLSQNWSTGRWRKVVHLQVSIQEMDGRVSDTPLGWNTCCT